MRQSLAAALALTALAAACAPTGPEIYGAPTIQPAALTAAPEVRLVSAIERNGCLMTASNVETILLDANLTQAELVEITPQLAAAGRAEVSGEGAIRVLTDNCI